MQAAGLSRMTRVYRPERDVEVARYSDRVERDLATQAGAQMLAHELDHWWHTRGYTQVKHWVELTHIAQPRRHRSDDLVWCVRSNLVNGLPPSKGAS
jgi:hypothetical protein